MKKKKYKYTDEEAVYYCDECDGWHIHDEALAERGLTEEMIREFLENKEDKDGQSSQS